MTICERMFSIIDANERKSAAGLCKTLGIGTSQTTSWRQRNTDPPAKYITQICEYLEISISFLLTGEDIKINKGQSDALTYDEQRLITKYRQLDEDGKDVVRASAIDELRRVESERASAKQAG